MEQVIRTSAGESLAAMPRDGAAQRPAIALINAYSTRNLGDAAIMKSLTAMIPDGRAQVVLADEQPVFVPGVDVVADLDGARQFISVGGDIFNNARPSLVTRAFLGNIASVTRRPEQTMLFGQTVPSSCGWLGRPLLARALRQVGAVVVRDCESFSLLRRHGVDARLSFDAAFALAPTDRGVWSAAALFAAAGLQPERTALISVRSFDSIYRHDEVSFLDRMARTAELLIGRGHQVAVMVQSDVNTRDSDSAIVRLLQQRVPGLKSLDFMGGDHEQLSGVLAADQPLTRHVRFFVGYSGWGKDQLDNELNDRSWLVTKGTKKRIMDVRTTDLWGETLRAMGSEYAPLANFPEDPSQN